MLSYYLCAARWVTGVSGYLLVMQMDDWQVGWWLMRIRLACHTSRSTYALLYDIYWIVTQREEDQGRQEWTGGVQVVVYLQSQLGMAGALILVLGISWPVVLPTHQHSCLWHCTGSYQPSGLQLVTKPPLNTALYLSTSHGFPETNENTRMLYMDTTYYNTGPYDQY